MFKNDTEYFINLFNMLKKEKHNFVFNKNQLLWMQLKE